MCNSSSKNNPSRISGFQMARSAGQGEIWNPDFLNSLMYITRGSLENELAMYTTQYPNVHQTFLYEPLTRFTPLSIYATWSLLCSSSPMWLSLEAVKSRWMGIQYVNCSIPSLPKFLVKIPSETDFLLKWDICFEDRSSIQGSHWFIYLPKAAYSSQTSQISHL